MKSVKILGKCKILSFLWWSDHLVWFEGSLTLQNIASSEGDVSNILRELFVTRDKINTNFKCSDWWLKKILYIHIKYIYIYIYIHMYEYIYITSDQGITQAMQFAETSF